MQSDITGAKPDYNVSQYKYTDPDSDPCLAQGVSSTDDPLMLEPVGAVEEPKFQPLGIVTTMEDVSYFAPEILEISQPSVEQTSGDPLEFNSHLTQFSVAISVILSQLETNVRETSRVENSPFMVRLAITAPKHVTFGKTIIYEYINQPEEEVVPNSENLAINSEGSPSNTKCKGSPHSKESKSPLSTVPSESFLANGKPGISSSGIKTGSSSSKVKSEGTKYQHNIINKRGEKNEAKQPKTVLCVRCKRYVQSQVHLKRHVNTVHFGLRPYICILPHKKESLKREFKRKDHLSKHLRTVHDMDEEEIKEYQEKNCPK